MTAPSRNVGALTESLKIGDEVGGNYLEIELDGTALNRGTSTVWDDLVGSLISRRLSSTAGKLTYNYDENSITMKPGGVITNTDDSVIFNFQYPHAAITDGTMNLHVHWNQINTDVIEWTLWYRIQENGAAKVTSWSTASCASDVDSAFVYTSGVLNQITSIHDIDLTAAGISATVQFRLARTDVTANDIEAYFVDAHVEKDSNGSHQPWVK